MADAVRARELEARVAALEARIRTEFDFDAETLVALEKRVAALENGLGSQTIRLMQGQINSLRAKLGDTSDHAAR